jgi:hypothetical protein
LRQKLSRVQTAALAVTVTKGHTMYRFIAGMVFAVGCVTSAGAPSPNDDINAPIHQFIDSFNKGDEAAAVATHTADVVIIDEVPPFMWQGRDVFKTWDRTWLQTTNLRYTDQLSRSGDRRASNRRPIVRTPSSPVHS